MTATAKAKTTGLAAKFLQEAKFDLTRGKTQVEIEALKNKPITSLEAFETYLSVTHRGKPLYSKTKELLTLLFSSIDNDLASYLIIPSKDGFPTDEKEMTKIIQSAYYFFERHVRNYWIGRSWGWKDGERVVTLIITPGPRHAHGHRKAIK